MSQTSIPASRCSSNKWRRQGSSTKKWLKFIKLTRNLLSKWRRRTLASYKFVKKKLNLMSCCINKNSESLRRFILKLGWITTKVCTMLMHNDKRNMCKVKAQLIKLHKTLKKLVHHAWNVVSGLKCSKKSKIT